MTRVDVKPSSLTKLEPVTSQLHTRQGPITNMVPSIRLGPITSLLQYDTQIHYKNNKGRCETWFIDQFPIIYTE